ncbi:MAG TPA: hypothetical protein VH062_17535 [Polyangiaceae bacterium]|jgi:hypothetical protein|nr:hypothetical protein [Polyangiaceae bacterium]
MATQHRTSVLPEALHAQASIILSALDDFLRASPGREIRITHDFENGFAVTLRESHVSRGESLRDAAAQVAQVLLLDGGAL